MHLIGGVDVRFSVHSATYLIASVLRGKVLVGNPVPPAVGAVYQALISLELYSTHLT